MIEDFENDIPEIFSDSESETYESLLEVEDRAFDLLEFVENKGPLLGLFGKLTFKDLMNYFTNRPVYPEIKVDREWYSLHKDNLMYIYSNWCSNFGLTSFVKFSYKMSDID